MANVNRAPSAVGDAASAAAPSSLWLNLTGNDTDPDGDTLAVTAVGLSGTKGIVTLDPANRAGATYSPGAAFSHLSAGETATDTFTYTISDGHGGTSTATATITVTGVNQAPVASNVTGATVSGTGIWVNLNGLDSDPNAHDVLSVTGFGTDGTKGTPKLNATPNNGFGYSPGTAFAYLSAGETAVDTFTYTISDGHGGTSTATAAVTVTGVNTAPIAAADTAATVSGAPVVLNVLSNDTDTNRDDVLAITAVNTTGTKGTVTLNPGSPGGVTYSPGTAFGYLSVGETATDKFTYMVSDGHGGTSTASATVTVTGVNQGPAAPNVTGATVSGTGIWVNLSGLDSDPNAHDVLSVTGFGTAGTKGTPKLNATPNNGFGYSPGTAFAYLSAGETATDKFTYSISDGHGGTSTATAAVTVTGVNTAPVATTDRPTTDASHAVTISVLGNDTDANLHDTLSVASLNMTGAQGSAVINTDGTVTYTPGGSLTYLAAGKTATDSFSYTVSDGHGGTSAAPVQVTVTGTWKPPVATADSAGTDARHAVTINVLGNDTDLQNGVALSVASVVTTGIKGGVAVNADNTLTYTPAVSFGALSVGETATDTFTYTVLDGHGGTSTASVAVTVAGVNQGPTAQNVTGATVSGTGIWVNLNGLDSDPNAHDVLSVTGFGTDGTKGTPKLNATPNNGFGYSPGTAFAYLSAGETAVDTFTYSISDGHGGTSTATAAVTVTGVNTAPVAAADTAATVSGAPVVLNVLSNDTDTNRDDVLAITAVNTAGTKGTVTLNPGSPGGVTYSPGTAFAYLSAGETATDKFTYMVSDGHGGTSTASATVTVTGVNQGPAAPNVTGATVSGTGIWVNLSGLDSDPNAHDVLSVTGFGTAGTKGTPKLNATPNNGFGYSPGTAFAYLSAGETATDKFTYSISDGHGGTSTATAVVIVTGVNTAPVATADTAATVSGAPVVLNVLSNDTDANRDDVLTVSAVNTTGTKGAVTIKPGGGGVTYAPGSAFAYLSVGETATDRFTYTVSDGHGGTSTASATVTVTGVNQGPTAPNVAGATVSGAGIWVNLNGIDSDPNAHDVLSVTGFGTAGTKGTPKLNATPNNGFGYSPGSAFAYLSAGETATDTFTYSISDGHGAASTATATITVSGVNVAPVAAVDSTATDASHAVTLNVLRNDSDANLHDTLSVASLDMTGAQGSAIINTGGTVTYTPGGSLTYLAAGKTATDSFSYTVADGHGGTSVAPVQVTVTGTWKPPVATADNAGTDAQHAVTINVLGNDTDPQSGVTLRVASVDKTGTDGSVVVNPNGTITYTPGAAFAGLVAGTATTDSFSYTLSDGHGGTSMATVTVKVGAPGAGADAPQAVYIATNGNDAWSGLLAQPNAAGTDGPKASLQAAELVMRNSAAVKTAYVEGGDYYLASSLNLGPADAGQTWLAYPGDSVRVHGGTLVDHWTQGAGGIWTAQAPAGVFAAGSAATDLFYNGNRETLSRYPDEVPTDTVQGGWLIAAPSLPGQNTSTSFQFKAGDIPAFASSDGLYVNIYSQNGWQNYSLAVSSIDYTTNTITLSGSVPLPVDAGSRYYLFNASSQLTAPDEWYYDGASNTISYLAPSGFTGSSGVVVGDLNNIINVYNTNNITIGGLTLTDSLNTGSGINVANSTGVTVTGNTIENVGVGVSFSSNSSNDVVEGNDISTTGGNGVQLPAGTHDISVLGNYIHDIGQLRAANGVWLSGSSNDTISNNLIQNVSKSGISVGASTTGVGSYNDAITYNEIGYANQATSDGGGIYINGANQQDLTGDLVAYNKVYGTTAAGTVSSAGVSTAGFLPASQLVSFGIYLDDYASGAAVTGNLVMNNLGGIDVHSGWSNTVSGNFLINNTGAALQNQAANALGAGSQPSAGNVFSGNLISTADPTSMAAVNLGTAANAQWINNFYDTTTLGGRVFAALVSGGYQAKTLTDWEALGYDRGSQSGAAALTGSGAGGGIGNDTLAAGSPALAAGIENLPVGQMGLAGWPNSNLGGMS